MFIGLNFGYYTIYACKLQLYSKQISLFFSVPQFVRKLLVIASEVRNLFTDKISTPTNIALLKHFVLRLVSLTLIRSNAMICSIHRLLSVCRVNRNPASA